MTVKTNAIQRNLLGCLEMMLFMPVGKTRFSANKSDAMRSFALYLVSFPLAIAIAFYTPIAGKLGQSLDSVAILYALNMILSTAGVFGVTYMLAKYAGKQENFFQFVNAFNWLVLPNLLAVVPIIYLVTSGQHSWEETRGLFFILSLYGSACMGFMITHTLRVPWQLGGAIAIAGMLIGDLSFRTIIQIGQAFGA
jgi:hypothetical protein